MTWYMWLAAIPIFIIVVWNIIMYFAKRGHKRQYLIPVVGDGIVPVNVFTGHWFGNIMPMTGISFKQHVWVDYPGVLTGSETGNAQGRVVTLDLMVHELMHAVVQARRLKWMYLPTYLWHRIVRLKSWKNHPMEKEADRLAANWLNGDRTVIGELPASFLTAYPHRRGF